MNVKYLKWVFHFDLKDAKIELENLEVQVSQVEFWDNQENSTTILKRIKELQTKIESFETLKNTYDSMIEYIDMVIEEEDDSLAQELLGNMEDFYKSYEELRIATLLSGIYDTNNAIISLHAGAGGTESCDWVSMLYRMYARWVDRKGFTLEVLDMLDGDEAGIKSITCTITGVNAYGYLKSEKGIHRLVRISPFDSAGRRHTSFASCDVMPEVTDEAAIEIKDEDIRIDTFRASGAGGQHINKTDSAIRITHLETNTVVQCQNERSQHKNKDQAMKMLRSALAEIREQERLNKLQDIRGEVKDNSWGSQIRSYVMHPYSMVKDHRTNEEKGNVQAVMDGDIDAFMNAYLNWITSKK
jgi:peptide chain release factor 2